MENHECYTVEEYSGFIFGSKSVGKTCLLERICYKNKHISMDQIPTACSNFAVFRLKPSQLSQIKVFFHEYSGKAIANNFAKMSVSFFSYKVQFVIFMFDITDRQSYQDVECHLRNIGAKMDFRESFQILLGNKLDLVEQTPQLRKVSIDEAENFARRNEMLFYEEISCTRYDEIEIFLLRLTDSIRDKFSSCVTRFIEYKPNTTGELKSMREEREIIHYSRNCCCPF